MPPAQAHQLLRSAPYFPVRDVEAAVLHYERAFGFRLEYCGGTPPEFAIVARDGLSVMLRLVSQSIVPNEGQGGTWDVYFWVEDVEALHSELLARGAAIVYSPTLQEQYQMKEFAVRDGEGYVLGFGQTMPTSSH